MRWTRRGVGWPIPNPGAAFSSDVSGFETGEWFKHTLCDWVGGMPVEMSERRKQFEIEEQDMKKKAAKKLTRKTAKKASRAAKPSKAKAAFNARALAAMSGETPAAQETRAEVANTMTAIQKIADSADTRKQQIVVNVEYRTAAGAHPHHDDLEREELLKTVMSAPMLSSDHVRALINHLKFAHERLKDIDSAHMKAAEEMIAEHKAELEKVAGEGAAALGDVKAAEERGQNSALKDIAEMFGTFNGTPEQNFELIVDVAKLWKGGELDADTTLRAKLKETETARDVCAEAQRKAEREREQALHAAKLSREDADKARKERAQAESERDAALQRTEAAQKRANDAERVAKDAAALAAGAATKPSKKNGVDATAVQDQTLIEVAGMFGEQCATAEEAFKVIVERAGA